MASGNVYYERHEKMVRRRSTPVEKNERVEASDNPRNHYYWGGQLRDKRSNSMCARPYFPY